MTSGGRSAMRPLTKPYVFDQTFPRFIWRRRFIFTNAIVTIREHVFR